jgi:hypothetical protein
MQLDLRVALDDLADQTVTQLEDLLDLLLLILPVLEQTLQTVLIGDEEEDLDQDLHDEQVFQRALPPHYRQRF